jgi:hypothetical protein
MVAVQQPCFWAATSPTTGLIGTSIQGTLFHRSGTAVAENPGANCREHGRQETCFDTIPMFLGRRDSVGHPVLAIPAGRDGAGLPFGIIGPRGGDVAMLAVAHEIETLLTANSDFLPAGFSGFRLKPRGTLFSCSGGFRDGTRRTFPVQAAPSNHLLNEHSSKLNPPPKPFGSRHLRNELHPKVFSECLL